MTDLWFKDDPVRAITLWDNGNTTWDTQGTVWDLVLVHPDTWEKQHE